MIPRPVAVLFLLALWPCLLVSAADAADGKRSVTLVSDPWPPYILGETGSEASGGVGAELLREIFARLENVELSMPLLPWNRALREVQLGTKDGIGILVKTGAREAYMEYTEEVFRSYNTIWYFAHKFPNGFEWREYADFEPYNIGIIGGHSYGQEFDRIVASGSVRAIEVPSADHLFAMLEKGRIDLAIADKLVGGSFVSRFADDGKRLLAATKPGAAEIYYIAFSRKSPARQFIPALNRIVAELREEGVIQDLVGADSQVTIESSMRPASDLEN